MNYFEVWMGDYLRKTMHLDSTEHGVYFMLMVAYYSDEKPLPNDLKKLCRICKAHSQKERDAVAKILEEFFQLSEDGCYHNAKCDSIIERFRIRSEVASESGKKGGRPPKSNEKPQTESEPFISEKPNESSLNPKPQTLNPNLLNIHKADGFLTDTERATILLEEIRIPLPDVPKIVTQFEIRSLRGLISQHGFPKVEEAINKCGVKKWQGTISQITDFILGKIKEKDYSGGKTFKPPETNTNLPAYKPYIDKTRDVKREPMPQDIRTLLQGVQQ